MLGSGSLIPLGSLGWGSSSASRIYRAPARPGLSWQRRLSGDVYPFLALAVALQARGHACTIATSDIFRADIEAAGVAFKRMRPDLRDDPEFVAKLFNPVGAARFWFHEVQMPVIEEAYEDVSALMRDADLLISRSLAYAAPIVAEVTGVPWITAKLSPAECMSAYDPPYIHNGRWIARLIRHSPAASGWTMRRFRQVVRALNFDALKNVVANCGCRLVITTSIGVPYAPD